MIHLGVNIDHVATLREARGGTEPSVEEAARIAEASGADGITVHLREDRRHIQEADVYRLREIVTTQLNLEMAVDEAIVQIALDLKPKQVTLVPEKREELTTEGGLDVVQGHGRIQEVTKRLQEKGIRVSLFIDPAQEQVRASQELGADCVELHTGEYANAKGEEIAIQFSRLLTTAQLVNELGMVLNAGHGLNYTNVKQITTLPKLHELNIGHSIISHAIQVGLGNAVSQMKALLCSEDLRLQTKVSGNG